MRYHVEVTGGLTSRLIPIARIIHHVIGVGMTSSLLLHPNVVVIEGVARNRVVGPFNHNTEAFALGRG